MNCTAFTYYIMLIAKAHVLDCIIHQGHLPQSFVLPPLTEVKCNVKGQEAKIVKVKGQAWFLKESKEFTGLYVSKQANVLTVLG